MQKFVLKYSETEDSENVYVTFMAKSMGSAMKELGKAYDRAENNGLQFRERFFPLYHDTHFSIRTLGNFFESRRIDKKL